MSVKPTSDQPGGYLPRIEATISSLMEQKHQLKEIDIRAHLSAIDPTTLKPYFQTHTIHTLSCSSCDSKEQLANKVMRVFILLNDVLRRTGPYGLLTCQTLIKSTNPSLQILKIEQRGTLDSDEWNMALFGSVPKNMERSKL